MTFWRLMRLPVRHRGQTKLSELPCWWVQCSRCDCLTLATQPQMAGEEAIACSCCGATETREIVSPLRLAVEVDAITLAVKGKHRERVA